jgi:hypothetical protein
LCLRVVLGRGAAASSGGGSFASAGGLRCQSVPAARGPVWFLGGGGFFQSFHPQKGLQHVTVTASVAHRLLSSFVPPSRCGSPWACWPGAGLPIPRRGRSFCLACQRAKSHVLVIGRLFAQPPRSPGLCWFLAVLGHLIHCPRRAAVGVTSKGVIMPANIQTVSWVLWSAFRHGGFVGSVVRPSSHSSSGWVAVAVFRSQSQAGKFAALSARRSGVNAFVRKAPKGRWAVSVPVSGPASGAIWSSGHVRGVRGVAAAVAAWQAA